MKGRIITGLTPQQKMVAVNNKFGNSNIKNQQGTTRTLYHSLPLDGRTTYRFFENAQQVAFPLTNLGADGNRLQVGETFTLQKIYFTIIGQDAQTGAWSEFDPVATNALPGLSIGELDFIIANSQVLKQLPTGFVNVEQNFTASNTNDVTFNFATDIVIPPLLEFVAQVRLALGAVKDDFYIRCTIQGTAGILAPQTTF